MRHCDQLNPGETEIPSRILCYIMAGLYYSAVVEYGQDAYNEAQKEAAAKNLRKS